MPQTWDQGRGGRRRRPRPGSSWRSRRSPRGRRAVRSGPERSRAGGGRSPGRHRARSRGPTGPAYAASSAATSTNVRPRTSSTHVPRRGLRRRPDLAVGPGAVGPRAAAELRLLARVGRVGAVQPVGGRRGVTLRLPDDTDFDDLGDRLDELGLRATRQRRRRLGRRAGPALRTVGEPDPRAGLRRPRRRRAPGAGLRPAAATSSRPSAPPRATPTASTGLDEVAEATGRAAVGGGLRRRLRLRRAGHGSGRRRRPGAGRRAGGRRRHRRPVPRLRDGRCSPTARCAWRWRSPTTTRPGSTPTAAPSLATGPARRAGRRLRRPVRAARPPAPTGRVVTLDLDRRGRSTCSATSAPARCSSPPAESLSCAPGDAASLRARDQVTESRFYASRHATQRKRRSRRLLVTTTTLERAIAAPAIIGFSRPAAASGMAATL